MTVGVCRCQGRFEEKHWSAVDANNTTMLFLFAANSWMGIRLVRLAKYVCLVLCYNGEQENLTFLTACYVIVNNVDQ